MSLWTDIANWFARPSAKDRAVFYRDLATAIERSEPLLQFLNGEIANTKINGNKSRAWLLKNMLRRRSGAERSNDGVSELKSELSFLLKNSVPTSDLMMLAAIDKTSEVSQQVAGLRRLAYVAESKAAMVKDSAKQMIMPVVAIPVIYAVILPTAFMVNDIHKTAPAELWQGISWLTLVICRGTLAFGHWIMLALLVAMIALWYWLPRLTGSIRLKLDALPGIGLYREFVGADIAMSLAGLLDNKVDIIDALKLIQSRGSLWTRWQVRRVLASLSSSGAADYQRAFGRGIFSPDMVARIATVTRTSPSFSDALIDIGSNGIQEVRERISLSTQAVSFSVIAVFATLALIVSIGQLVVMSDLDRLNAPDKVLERQQRQANQR